MPNRVTMGPGKHSGHVLHAERVPQLAGTAVGAARQDLVLTAALGCGEAGVRPGRAMVDRSTGALVGW
jgi:hypothetical protein